MLGVTLKPQTVILYIAVATVLMSGYYANNVLLMHIDPILCIEFRSVLHSTLYHACCLIYSLAMEWHILRVNNFENIGPHNTIKPRS